MWAISYGSSTIAFVTLQVAHLYTFGRCAHFNVRLHFFTEIVILFVASCQKLFGEGCQNDHPFIFIFVLFFVFYFRFVYKRKVYKRKVLYNGGNRYLAVFTPTSCTLSEDPQFSCSKLALGNVLRNQSTLKQVCSISYHSMKQ